MKSNSDIAAIFSAIKERRLNFYRKMIREFDELDEWSMKLEKITYNIFRTFL